MDFDFIVPGIARLKVPFEDSYTSVFLISEGGKHILVDCAATEQDAERIILPALGRMALIPDEIVLSHAHTDHAGGLPALLRAFPEIPVRLNDETTAHMLNRSKCLSVNDGDRITESVQLLCLRGHCDDEVALFDLRTHTLISCDCVQLRGGGRYGINVSDAIAYFSTLERIKTMPIENLVASHEYEPLGAEACGREAVLQYVAEAEHYAREVEHFVKSRHGMDFRKIAEEWNLLHRSDPPISDWTMKNFSA